MSGSKRKPLIAWDSCVFLAHFKQEKDKDLFVIREILQAFANGTAQNLVSVLVGAEVLDDSDHHAGSHFTQYVHRSSVSLADADWRIARKAALLRQNVSKMIARKVLTKGLKAPDSLIAATACVYKADVLHTYDPTLLHLSGCKELDGLAIERPSLRLLAAGQMSLLSLMQPEDGEQRDEAV